MSEATELLDQLMIEQKARLKAIAQLTDLTHERDELKARVSKSEEVVDDLCQYIQDLRDGRWIRSGHPSFEKWIMNKEANK